MNILDRLEKLIGGLNGSGIGEGEIGATLKRLIHSPVVALLVKLSPNKADDAALELLKGLFPAA